MSELLKGWGIAEPSDIIAFKKQVKTEGHSLLQNLLNDEWFNEMLNDCKDIHSQKKREHSHQYFPIRWLLEEGEWDFINQGLKLVDGVTKKKGHLKQLVRGILLDDWMLSSTNALGLSVICRFAHDRVLVDIEPKISTKSEGRADALVNVSGRDIFIEATLLTKDLVSPDTMMGSLSVEDMMYQTISKLMSKANQLQHVEDPVVLVTTCSPRIGADPLTAKWAVLENIGKFPLIGAVIVSGGYRFRYGGCYFGQSATIPLTDEEKQYFSTILILPDMLRNH